MQKNKIGELLSKAFCEHILESYFASKLWQPPGASAKETRIPEQKWKHLIVE